MKKQIQILMSGILAVIPLAVTIYVLLWAANKVNEIGVAILGLFPGTADADSEAGEEGYLFFGVGVLLVLGLLYVAGLLTRLWVFRWFLAGIDRLMVRLPGIKTIYESMRDLLAIFGGGRASQMGRVVEYRNPATGMTHLGILTNDRPEGMEMGPEGRRVAVYLPMSYMIGGPTVYVPADDVRTVDMSVDRALKLAATAHLGSAAMAPRFQTDEPPAELIPPAAPARP